MKHTTLKVLVDQFDAFFIDQFGVLMDATGPYPFAIEAIKKLSEYNKPIILISNSGKRSEKNIVKHLVFALLRQNSYVFSAFIDYGEI